MPEPSRLVLLDELHTIETGTKIRFLACVHAYDQAKAHLELRDHYPATDVNTPTAIVNIENVLENLNRDMLTTGAWLNVIGTVRKFSSADVSLPKKAKATMVDATLVWSAGAIKTDKYEAAIREYQQSVPN